MQFIVIISIERFGDCMKKFFAIVVILILCLSLNRVACFASPVAAAENGINTSEQPTENDILSARFTNLLNQNRIYGYDFLSNEALVNAAAVNLCTMADDKGFIDSSAVQAFVADMYDITLEITDDINVNFPKAEGKVYVIPRGYSSYSHNIKSITDCGDFYLVKSDVIISSHDGTVKKGTAESKIIVNEKSSFGYSIIDAEMTVTDVSSI